MQFKVSSAPKLEGVINLPGDKSVTQRAILLNSIATGNATIRNNNTGNDALSMFNCLQDLGANIKNRFHKINDEPFIEIHGLGLNGLHQPKSNLNAEISPK